VHFTSNESLAASRAVLRVFYRMLPSGNPSNSNTSSSSASAQLAHQRLPHAVIQWLTAAALYGKQSTSKHPTSTIQR
jgi:hypothetical protein